MPLLKRLGKWLWRKIALILAILVVLPAVWYVTALRDQLMRAGTSAADWALQSQNVIVRTTAMPLVTWAICVLIVIALIMIVSLFFRIMPSILVLSEDLLRTLANFVALAANVAFAVYAYHILWGTLRVFGDFTIVEKFDPDKITFSLGAGLGKAAVAYLFCQALPLLFKPRISVGWSATDIFFSAIPLFVVLSALLAYMVGQYEWTTYRLEALWIWVPMELVDVTMAVAGLRYLTRGFISSEEVVRTHG